MRVFLVILLALVAVGAAGVWALGEFGHVFSGSQTEAREPLVIEPEIVAANDQVAPAAPTPNSAPTLQSQQAPAAAAPAPASEPAPAVPEAKEEAAPAPVEAAPAEPARARAASAPRRSAPLTADRLDEAGPTLRSAAPQDEPAQAAPPPPPPAPPPSEPSITAQSAPASQPAAPASTQAAAASAAPAAAPAGLEAQFKSRKITYNRPPAKLALNKAIDVSLVINATEDENAGQEALQGFPGEVVERDVELSDTVSAQLTGIGFDISTQTVERQKLSSRTVNRWQWRVTPTELGTRTLTLDIFGYASGSLDAEPLAAYRDEIVVEVQQFDQIVSWAKSVQPVFGVLAALAGVFSALFAFLRFREEKKRKA